MRRREFLRSTAAAATLASVGTAAATAQGRPLFESALVGGTDVHPVRGAAVFDIGDRKQLFLDHAMIDRTERISKFVGRVQKYADNPVLVPDRPWERGWTGSDGIGYKFPKDVVSDSQRLTRTEGLRITGQVALYDQEEKLFKLWYLPWLNSDLSEFWCYAVSRDGYHWEKPELGLFEYQGSKKNNILTAFRTGSYFNVIKDPHDLDPARRYKALGEQEPNDGTAGRADGAAAAFSADGLRWTPWAKNPVVPKGPNITDAPTMLGWDPLRRKYVAYFRPGVPIYPRPGVRTIGYTESDDFLHWSATKLMLAMDDQDRVDYEYMQFTAGVHGDFYVGFLMVQEKHEQTWSTYLLSSRDGFHWTWVDRQRPFLGRGEIGSYDAAYQTPSGPIVHDGQIWIYYGAFRAAHSFLPSKYGNHDVMTVALATLPVDRYCGLLGGEGPGGTVLTLPLKFHGSKLWLDFDASLAMQRSPANDPRNSRLRGAVLSEKGDKLESFALDRCRPLHGQGRQELTWPGGDLGQLAGKPVRLLLEIQNAALYSLQFA